MKVSFILAALSALQLPQPDTSRALEEAERLVTEFYSDVGTYYFGTPCNGVYYGDCSDGEWRWPYYLKNENHKTRRAALIPELDRLAREAGNAEWLYRQRVAFAIRHGDYVRASRIAASCDSSNSWCLRLRGLTRHLLDPGSGIAQFDSAFAASDSAGAASNSETGCAWSHPRFVLPEEDADAPGAWSCPQNHDRIRYFWWLADPLWSVPGNARYAEHLARHEMIRMDRDVQRLLESSPGTMRDHPHAALLRNPDTTYAYAVRQGFPNSRSGWADDVCRIRRCEVEPPPMERMERYRGMERRDPVPYVRGGYSFTPSLRVLADAVGSTTTDWQITWLGVGCIAPWNLEDCGPERMMPRRLWHNLEQQTAVFRRGRDLLVASAAHLPDSIGSPAAFRGALALGRVRDMNIDVFQSAIDANGVFRASAQVDSGGYVASIEVVSANDVGRARFGIAVPPMTEGFGVSDMALVDPANANDIRGETVSSALLARLHIPAGTPLGVYFEVYGLHEDEAVDIALGTERLGAGWLRRFTRWMGLADGVKPVVAQWQETVSDGTRTLVRYYEIDTRPLDRGDYRLVLAIRRAEGTEATSTRLITVR